MRRWRLVGSEVGRPLADERRRARRHPGRLVGVRLPVEPRHQLEDAEPVAAGPVRACLEHHAVEVGCEGLAPLAAALGHAARALGHGPGPRPGGALELADPGGHQVVERGVVDEARFQAQPPVGLLPGTRGCTGQPRARVADGEAQPAAVEQLGAGGDGAEAGLVRRAEHLVRVRAGHELVDEPRSHAVGRGAARDAPARVGEPGGHVGEVGLDVDAGVGHAVGEVVGEGAELLDRTQQLGGATGGATTGDDQVGERVERQRGDADPRRRVTEDDVAEGAAAQAVLEHRDRGARGDGELDAADAGRERVSLGVLVADPLVGQAQPQGGHLAVGAGRGGERPQDGPRRGRPRGR